MIDVRYPFVPKSTAHLVPGQFWSIPLSNGRFACGRVLQLDECSRRMFLAGLLDWCGEVAPTHESIANAGLLAHGAAHVKTIAENQGAILGCRSLDLDGLDVPLSLDTSPGPGCLLRRGFERLGAASASEQQDMHPFRTWGYRVIKLLAEKRFARRPDDSRR